MAGAFVKCAKGTLFIISGLVFLVGLLGFGLGVLVLVDTSPAVLAGQVVVGSSLTVGGLVVAVFGLLGGICACKQSKCFLFVYFLLLLGLFIAIAGGTLMAYIEREEVDRWTNERMYSSINHYGTDPDITAFWNKTQEEFKCCGVVKKEPQGSRAGSRESPKGYMAWSSKYGSRNEVPESCCKNNVNLPQRQPCFIPAAYTDDCYVSIKEWLKGNAVWIAAIALIVEVILALGSSLSLALVCMKE